MHVYSILASAMTVISFFLFIAICAWAYSKHRRQPYEDAANAPFALPDDLPRRYVHGDGPPRAVHCAPARGSEQGIPASVGVHPHA